MKYFRHIHLYAAIVMALSTLASEAAATGPVDISSGNPVTVIPDKSTGLDCIYVLETADGAVALYDGGGSPTFSRFSNLGAAYAEELTNVEHLGNGLYRIPLDNRDMGYMIHDNATGRNKCFWVVDYSAHALRLESVAPAPEAACDRMTFNFTGKADAIDYYTINGRREELSREIEIEYQNLTFDETSFSYRQTEQTEYLSHIGPTFTIQAPLCDTHVTLSGDRFLKAWNRAETIQSASVPATAVAVETKATQTTVASDNEQKDGDSEGLGGSAPCEIIFEAAVSDAAIFREWQISRTPEFDIIENSYNDTEFTYTFRENGTTYIRFIAADADNVCTAESTVYQIFIGESKLDIPNAFSPGSTPGVNDEWKVSYRSIIDFECHIFNRWGTEMTSFTDPSQGWDGKYGGKLVPAGTYYYVINATGADGVKYKRSGDINIINFTTGPHGSDTAE